MSGMLNISQPYRPPRPVTGIALLYLRNPEEYILFTEIISAEVEFKTK
jgi:hypothetical protein